MKTKALPNFDLPRYLRLVRRFPLVPITTEEQLDQAIAITNKLVDRQLTPEGRTVEEDAYLLVLCNLIEKYEDVAYPTGPLDDSDVLTDLLDERGVTQAELARGAGIAESTISEVLHGKRKLTRKQIGKVADFFNVAADLFDPRV